MPRNLLPKAVSALLVCALMPHTPAAADPFLPVPPASFLNYHVDTVPQLTQEVAFDPIVRARLARHFHMTDAALVAYIHDNLALSHLARGGRYKVACLTPSGRDYWITLPLAAGTPVFALKTTGKPILRLVCGNPLVSLLPPVAKPIALKPAALTKLPATTAVSPEAAGLPAPTSFAAPASLTGSPESALGPIVRVAGSSQAIGHGGVGFLPFIGALVGVGAISHGGGSHHGGGTPSGPTPSPKPGPSPKPAPKPTPSPPGFPPTPPSHPPSTSAVPEPNPGLVFAIGGSALAFLRLRRRKKN